MSAPASPFVINVGSLLRRPGAMEELELDVAVPERIGVPLLALEAGSPVEMDVRLERLVDGVLATVDVRGTLTGQCSRCLRPIEESFAGRFAELYGEQPDESLDYSIDGGNIDLEGPLRDAVVLDLPFQPLCEPGCLGLDPETGERLTEPLPEPDAEIDPRWAALAQVRTDAEAASAADTDPHTPSR